MAKERKEDRRSNTRDQQHNREDEHPQRPEPDRPEPSTDSKQSVGGRDAAKAEEDARNKSTRRGDR